MITSVPTPAELKYLASYRFNK